MTEYNLNQLTVPYKSQGLYTKAQLVERDLIVPYKSQGLHIKLKELKTMLQSPMNPND